MDQHCFVALLIGLRLKLVITVGSKQTWGEGDSSAMRDWRRVDTIAIDCGIQLVAREVGIATSEWLCGVSQEDALTRGVRSSFVYILATNIPCKLNTVLVLDNTQSFK